MTKWWWSLRMLSGLVPTFVTMLLICLSRRTRFAHAMRYASIKLLPARTLCLLCPFIHRRPCPCGAAVSSAELCKAPHLSHSDVARGTSFRR